ncbi:MAG: 50S ribosomal protein L22 [Halobacteriovoraceae bacterium]|jgi:large subunit ribosomal protein L22|nr:50S ribosomal protein L22 [Halobacteriovoraceae bacterium]MBC98427.1 50S ribosomal protein L22 [Halobacteriovoraceae bacterium]|tara:strand:- start:6857 stop:7192 length:336 start_codon:yes stop_codon:yes gene_type:complete
MAIVVKNSRVGIAPRKVAQVCDLVRNKRASEALKILRYCEKKEIAIMLTKLINSGLAIAADSEKYDIDNLVISTVYANEGPTLKRIQPRAQGRAFRVRKRTSHVLVEMKEA